MLIRKQARQPQARNASSGSRPAIENAPAASSSPPGTPMWAKLPKKPRLLRGGVLHGQQHGAAVLAADADALQDPQHHQGDRAPRRRSGRTSAAAPIAAVPTPMISRVRISIFLRPIRSPKWPKISPPTGRARNPTANVANAANWAAGPSSPLKYSLSKTRPAAVP